MTEGKLVKLNKPMIVCDSNVIENESSMKIIAIVRYKYIFSDRPKPITTSMQSNKSITNTSTANTQNKIKLWV